MEEKINKKIVIATHYWADYGPGQALREYLLAHNVRTLLWIQHPLMYSKRLSGSGYEVYKNGKKVKGYKKKIRKYPPVISYIKDFFLTIWFTLITKEKFDCFIGINNLNAFAGLFLKKVGVVKKSVYYVIDYTPKRFENKWLNWIYHKIESICALKCDEVWNLSPKMIEAREKFKGIKANRKHKIIPMGIWFDRIKRIEFEYINKHQLVFMGHIIKKQGVQFVIYAIPEIVKHIPDFKFLVIGEGEFLNELKKLVKDLKIDKFVEFTGYIKNHTVVEKLIAKSALAVALYEKGDLERNFTYYSDPGKIKVYLGAGVPVLLTDVPYNAKEIKKKKCGKIVEPEPKSIARAVVELMKNEHVLEEYRKNAIEYAKQFDWNLIFKEVIK